MSYNKNKKYHYFYKITNNLNGHFYYGVHNTNNLDDGYMGSGTRLHYAYKKYGIENFTKEILKYFDTMEDAFKYESEIVTENLIKNDNCYNSQLGGEGFHTAGLVVVKDNEGNHFMVSNTDKRYLSGELTSIIFEKILVKDKLGNIFFVSINDPRYLSGELKFIWNGKKHSNKTKEKMSNTKKILKSQQGEKNSQYGTCWINKNGNSIKIQKEELNKYLSDGWIKGRKYSEQELDKLRKKRNYSSESMPSYNTVWIYNDDLKKSIYIKKEELDKYLSNGWIKGRKIKF